MPAFVTGAGGRYDLKKESLQADTIVALLPDAIAYKEALFGHEGEVPGDQALGDPGCIGNLLHGAGRALEGSGQDGDTLPCPEEFREKVLFRCTDHEQYVYST